MLTRVQFHTIGIRNPKINERDVFVLFVNVVRIDVTGRRDGFDAPVADRRCFGENFYFQTAFFFYFAVQRLCRIFIELDMPADGQPLLIFFMVDQKDFIFANNENGDDKIIKFMDVRHDPAT